MKLTHSSITTLKHSSLGTVSDSPKSTYARVYLSGLGTLALLLYVLPQTAGAFWPIPFISAAGSGLTPPVFHDEKLPLLKAATHSDPNPYKGEYEIALSDDTALVAHAGAEGAISEVVDAPRAGQVSVYTVREGDTLSVIADMFGVSSNTILWANGIKKASLISPGTTLIILPVNGVKHTIAKGETLKGIAKKYDADADDIAAYNGLESGSALAVGTEIIIPGGLMAASTPAAPKIAATGKAAPVVTSSSGLFSNPVPGGRLTQGLHGYNGVDIGAPYGSPIYAAASGRVIVARADGYNGGYGYYVVIDHGNGAQTLYAHMSSVLAVMGTSVEKGELIGYVGSTGRSTGNHVHFEVRGGYRNPFAY